MQIGQTLAALEAAFSALVRERDEARQECERLRDRLAQVDRSALVRTVDNPMIAAGLDARRRAFIERQLKRGRA